MSGSRFDAVSQRNLRFPHNGVEWVRPAAVVQVCGCFMFDDRPMVALSVGECNTHPLKLRFTTVIMTSRSAYAPQLVGVIRSRF